MLQTEKHFNYLILFLHSFGWFYNIKIGFVGLQVMWITFCLNNWQKSREKQNKLSFASKKARRCLSCKFKFLPNNCQNFPNKVLYISRLTKYIFRTTLNVQWMFWSFSNCQILESNLGTFRKLSEAIQESLAVQISIPERSIAICRSLAQFSGWDWGVLVIFTSSSLSCSFSAVVRNCLKRNSTSLLIGWILYKVVYLEIRQFQSRLKILNVVNNVL